MYLLARTALVTLALPAMLAACQPQVEAAAPQARPVRTVTAEKREAGVPVTLTGRIEAEDEVALAFRISGRLLENDRMLGDRLEPGQVVARLESQNERNALRAAQANLAAAQGQLTQARNHFERQDTLLKQGWTTRANHDQAKQAQQTAQSQVDAAEAQLKAAHDLVELHRAQGRRARRRHRSRPERRRGRSGRADDRAGLPARTDATPSSTCRRS